LVKAGIGEENRGRVNNFVKGSFEFERMPKKNISFVVGKTGIELEIVEVLATDKPDEGRDEG